MGIKERTYELVSSREESSGGVGHEPLEIPVAQRSSPHTLNVYTTLIRVLNFSLDLIIRLKFCLDTNGSHEDTTDCVIILLTVWKAY